jgi:hypothetical protein
MPLLKLLYWKCLQAYEMKLSIDLMFMEQHMVHILKFIKLFENHMKYVFFEYNKTFFFYN